MTEEMELSNQEEIRMFGKKGSVQIFGNIGS